MDDLIGRQVARRYTFGNDEFSLEDAYHDCKLVFDEITDDDSFQKADKGLILYYANEIIYALQEALKGKGTNVGDTISRQAAIAEFSCCELTPDGGIDANNAIDFLKQMPSTQPEIIRCKDCRWWDKYGDYDTGYCMAARHGYWTEHWDISIRRKYRGDFYCADAEPNKPFEDEEEQE